MSRRLAFVPPSLSLAAFAIALVAGVTGWERNAADEQVGAHVFQLLIAVQLPIVLAYLATARQGRGRVLLIQVAMAAAAFVPVAVFGL